MGKKKKEAPLKCRHNLRYVLCSGQKLFTPNTQEIKAITWKDFDQS